MRGDSLRYTLVADGPTDDALLLPLTWLLRQNGVRMPIESAWADFRRFTPAPRTLTERIAAAVVYYECDLLFIHRDAEAQAPARRVDEIEKASSSARERIRDHHALPTWVSVIPVRMTEAWLLHDERAVRRAADNPNGRTALEMPRLSTLEEMPDPKARMYDLLRRASELSGRRLKDFRESRRARRVAELIEDYSPLRRLDAFRTLEDDIRRAIQDRGWA